MDDFSAAIGLFGGTFDPIHFGHLNLAFELMEKNALCEIWFLPARHNPQKSERALSASQHSYNMVKLAIAPIRQFKLLDIELVRPGPSYTIDTVEELLEKYGAKVQFYLLLGEDSLNSFSAWHRVEDLVRLIPLLVGTRNLDCNSQANWLVNMPAELKTAIMKGHQKTNSLDISSSAVRWRIAQGKYCGHLVPEKVLDYIYANRLYKS